MRRRPVSDRALAQVALALVAIAFVVLGTVQLQHTSPQGSFVPLAEALQEEPPVDVVTCERTLPGEDEDETVLGLVGRITSVDAVACPRRFDGRTVTYVGEVVGDVLRRDGGAWVQVNDDAYAMEVGPLPAHREFAGGNTGLSVWLPEDFVDVVARPGRRGLRGDVILVEGLFLRADPDDGGGLTIRATNARRLASATPIDRPVHVPQAIAAGVAALIALGTVLRERRVRTRH